MSNQADYAQLAEDLSTEDLRSVLAVFADDVRRLTGNLTDAAAAGDAAAFRRAAHALAGAAGAVGARALDQQCRTMMGHDNTASHELRVQAAATRSLADRAMAELAAFVARLDIVAGQG